MNIRQTAITSFIFLTFIFPSTKAWAEPATYILDKSHTQILFFADHLGFSKSMGKFLDFDGEFTFDEAAPENSRVIVSIKTESIEMNDEQWNEHMKSADFFYVSHFPEMTFESTGIDVTGEDSADITGNLTLLGITRPVTLKTLFNKAGEHPMTGSHIAGFSAHTSIRRSEFGMTYGLPGVGDEVMIRLEVEGIRQ